MGPVVYTKRIDDLTGEQLAEYRTQRIRVDLTPEERAAYDAAYATYTGYVREARLRESHGAGWWDELTRRSAHDAQARRAKVAELKLKDIVHQAQGKLDALDHLLREHRDQQMLIFTAHNRFAYQIARRHLIPVITHQTTAAERKAILDDFRAGQVSGHRDQQSAQRRGGRAGGQSGGGVGRQLIRPRVRAAVGSRAAQKRQRASRAVRSHRAQHRGRRHRPAAHTPRADNTT